MLTSVCKKPIVLLTPASEELDTASAGCEKATGKTIAYNATHRYNFLLLTQVFPFLFFTQGSHSNASNSR
jgi:hypothetical protein